MRKRVKVIAKYLKWQKLLGKALVVRNIGKSEPDAYLTKRVVIEVFTRSQVWGWTITIDNNFHFEGLTDDEILYLIKQIKRRK